MGEEEMCHVTAGKPHSDRCGFFVPSFFLSELLNRKTKWRRLYAGTKEVGKPAES